MKQEKQNIEEFLRDKLDGFDAGYQNDWSQFEDKLDRAIMHFRLKVGALIGVVLLLITLGIAGGEGISRLTSDQTRSVAQPAFINSLRQRAPFLVNSRFPVLTRYITEDDDQVVETVPAEAGNNGGSINNAVIVAEAENAEKAGKHQVLMLGTKAPASHELLAGADAGLKLQTANAIKSSAESALHMPREPVTASLLTEAEAAPSSESRFSEAPLLVYEDRALETEAIYTPGQSASGLAVKPMVMPVTLKKQPAYVSPLQASNPWSYSVSVYPNFTFRKFKVDREKLNQIHRDFIDATQEAEKGGFSLNVGFVVSRRIGRITYLNGGIEYINYKAVAEYDFLNYREATINPATEQIEYYTLLDDPERIQFNGHNVYHYLNFPLSISHQPWATDHVRLNIEAGGSFMYFLGASGQSIDYQSLELIDIADREYNNSIASLHMKVGVSYYISQNFNVGFEPTLMYFTNTIYSEDYPFQVIPYSVGVNFKLQMKL